MSSPRVDHGAGQAEGGPRGPALHDHHPGAADLFPDVWVWSGCPGGAHHAELRDPDVQTIGEQAVGLKVLQSFADKLLYANFAKSSLADWQAQFRIFEKQATFLEAVKRSQEAKATRPARQVNYLTGHPAEDDFSHQEPQDSSSGSDLLEQLAQLLAGGEVKTKGGKKEAAGKKAEDAAFVRRLVAAPMGGDRTAKDRDWVEANGVPGFAPPDDPRREPLMPV
ncbi:hypothetical protein AB1Y20_019598 [Prymnesium parvum]|uniref:Uncharacterized protein n=1 Tax=Prymnesium parvum TaxID=97485 RepID=A0AB34JRG0_PRYPA